LFPFGKNYTKNRKKKMKRTIPNPLLTTICLSLIVALASPISKAAQEPTQIDFSKITLDSLAPVKSDFSFPRAENIPAFDIKKGQKLVEAMPVAMLQAIGTKSYSPREIATLVGIAPKDLEQGQLGNLKYLESLKIKDLVSAIPGLADIKAGAVPGLGGYGSLTLGDIAKDPIIGNAALPAEVLAAATPKDLPGLMDTKYFDIPGIEKVPVADLTGMAQLPIDKSLNITVGVPGNLHIVKLDRVATKETRIGSHRNDKVVTGSDIKSNFPCDKDKECNYGELQSALFKGISPINGSKVLEGKSNMVEGGHGFLKPINGGKEPSNLEVPYISINGFSAGVSLENINQRQGTADQFLNLRFGFYILGTKHATPRFISIPIGTLQEGKGNILLPAVLAVSSQIPANSETSVTSAPVLQSQPLNTEPVSQPTSVLPDSARNARPGSAVISNPSNPALL
jgi:hypothetical protein